MIKFSFIWHKATTVEFLNNILHINSTFILLRHIHNCMIHESVYIFVDLRIILRVGYDSTEVETLLRLQTKVFTPSKKTNSNT